MSIAWIDEIITIYAHIAAQATPVDSADAHNMWHFVQQTDIVGKTLFGILVFMALITWYLIIVKTLVNFRQRHLSRSFLKRFWNSASLEQVDKDLHQYGAKDPFARLANQALHAADHYHRYGASNLSEVGTHAEFVTRSMRKVIDEETARVENGLTVLGSIGSTAPFVGLFGTVWGVYHALVGIGLSDGVSINKIAGPVGEALIMTGLGLAVAIPAVLAFNTFVRRNRVMLSKLDGFAHDLFAFVTTGQQVDNSIQRIIRTKVASEE
ncbi:flagellar motor protein MotA [Pelistega indica]|uniref:Biopolymer transport protein ExbB n=1 Tax=Pelistega indica TaxID=1414851 RepID=V8G5J6_9BURK|nr:MULTISPECIES: MotA/TolQ/ExbB proton channel family protein [Pelistega]ETD71361.1 flagellar motor protein MotA [Pelistega indica]